MTEPYEGLDYKEQMQRELNAKVAQRLVEDAAQNGRCYQTAVLSAANGRWGDVWTDVRRGRITASEANDIVLCFLNARLIAPIVAASHTEFIRRWLMNTARAEEHPDDATI